MAQTKITSARQASIEILAKFDDTYNLEKDLINNLEDQDRQQANEYIQGILRHRSYLDFLITHYSNVDFDEMGSYFKNILRLGIYDLLFMDGTPDYAAINEAVEIGKRRISSKTGDLVNAILRKIQRERNELPKPAAKNRTQLISMTFSHPEWLVERWVKRFGEREAFQLMQANNKRPAFYIKVNNLKTHTEYFTIRMKKSDISFTESDWLPGYYQVESIKEIKEKGWFEKGLCLVQDIAAGFAPWILDPQPGESVYDICAAPGTKTIVMANMMENKGSILAVDISSDRLEKIAENAMNYGAENIKIRRADATQVRLKLADAVLLDAPCTGTGVLSKRADLRWKRTQKDLDDAVAKQAELLDAAANMVSKNGRLVYSTCSLEPEENMGQIENFLNNYDNFELEDLSGYLPEEILSEDKKSYQTFPHIHHCDGHFGVLLRRKF
ncbi:MAG TPA: 16S rRNA (cytosine(967)-C(5))-methyltransferase RsmB [Balneolales bacterium]|nr:16S rRNA (cytosine(967)-C(5))-methyltransferase RsmB [Balneolales bacterium]